MGKLDGKAALVGASGRDAEAGAKALDATFTAVWGGQNATPEQMGQPYRCRLWYWPWPRVCLP